MKNKSFILAAVIFSCGSAFAGQAVLTWSAPTQMTDGTALAKCANQTVSGECLRSYKVYHGLNAASLTDTFAVNDRNALGYTWLNIGPGTHYFAVTALTGNGVESSLSAIGSKVIPNGTPNPPGNLTVQPDSPGGASGTAYRMRQSIDGFEMVPLGTVNSGTSCNSKSVDGYNLIPRSSVVMASQFDTMPLVVFAKCG